ncbi:hypothetical protein EVG20_g11306, partial [Dentipellis fragilis]
PSTEVFGTASIIWGVIGPGLQFSKGQTYYAPVLLPCRDDRARHSVAHHQEISDQLFQVHQLVSSMGIELDITDLNDTGSPVIFNGTGLIPPATALNYVPWARHFSWWTKYNYVLSAALDSGTAVSILVIFFWYVALFPLRLSLCDHPNPLQLAIPGATERSALSFIGETNILTWWGNTVPFTGADNAGTPVRPLAPGETFGPSVW